MGCRQVAVVIMCVHKYELTSYCTIVFNLETLKIHNNNNNLFYCIISLEPDDGPLAPKHLVVSGILLL
jgi:hypothetical protein